MLPMLLIGRLVRGRSTAAAALLDGLRLAGEQERLPEDRAGAARAAARVALASAVARPPQPAGGQQTREQETSVPLQPRRFSACCATGHQEGRDAAPRHPRRAHGRSSSKIMPCTTGRTSAGRSNRGRRQFDFPFDGDQLVINRVMVRLRLRRRSTDSSPWRARSHPALDNSARDGGDHVGEMVSTAGVAWPQTSTQGTAPTCSRYVASRRARGDHGPTGRGAEASAHPVPARLCAWPEPGISAWTGWSGHQARA